MISFVVSEYSKGAQRDVAKNVRILQLESLGSDSRMQQSHGMNYKADENKTTELASLPALPAVV